MFVTSHLLTTAVFTEDVLLFYGERYFDIELYKESDDTGLFVSNTVEIPNGLLIFNKRYNHLYVSTRTPRSSAICKVLCKTATILNASRGD